ncbi:ComEC/Rec2 family competence protein [Glaciecola sp. 1036]|uniref:ComEC/Rec2 family competence protein n=1 Tax=Alteromonadaceae TaxID=72275 RepID=UPI003D08CC7E
MDKQQRLYILFFILLGVSYLARADTIGIAKELEIHYINVGQGGSTLIIGPNGTRILYDFGNKSGLYSLIPYFESLNWEQEKKLHYTILSHRDRDHYYGFKDLIDNDFDVLIANYGPLTGNRGSNLLSKRWIEPATKTTAGAVSKIRPGMRISLGSGAELLVAAANGVVFDGTKIDVINENDRSVSILIKYNEFEFILDGDLGGGAEVCSGHKTNQRDVQTQVALSLIERGEISAVKGVDVFHVAHHGSESSSPARYLSQLKPEIGLISVGNPNCKYQHPRQSVIYTLLKKHSLDPDLLDKESCDDVTPVSHIFQTDRGSTQCGPELSSLSDNSNIISGDIVLSTDGTTDYKIVTSGVTWTNGRRVKTELPQNFVFNLD